MRDWFIRALSATGCVGLLVFLAASGCILEQPDVTGFFCNVTADCLKPLLCEGNTCLHPCFNDQDCIDGNTCSNGFCTLSNNPGDGGVVEQPCDLTAKELCDGKDNNCNGQIDEGIPCANEGETCDLAASPAIPCKPGLSCESFSAVRPRLCLRLCEVSDNTSCPDQKFICQQLGNIGVCVESPCTPGNCSLSSKVPHSCDSVGQGQILCRPNYPDGTIGFGQSCSPTQGQHCLAPYKCARRKEDLMGFCTLLCSPTASPDPCDDKAKGAKCEQLQDIFNVCHPPCQTNADCPNSMNCTAGLCRHG